MNDAPLLRALDRQAPRGVVPLWELSFQMWDLFGSGHVVIGNEFVDLSPKERERATAENADQIARVASELGFSGITLPSGYWEVAPGVATKYWLPESETISLVRRLRTVLDPEIVLVGSADAVIAIPNSDEYVDFCYRLFDAPEEVDRAASDLLRVGLETAKRLGDEGVVVVKSASDLADNRGPFFNPDQLERHVYPYMTEWAYRCREMGLKTILHTDGDVGPLLDRIVESGVDGLQGIDPTAGMDLAQVKTTVGTSICLCGNIDCGLLLSGTPEEVFESTQRTLAVGLPGGAFVLGASNAVVPETSVENYRALLEARRRFGTYD